MAVNPGPFSLDRVERAVERVRQRLLKSAAALEAAGVPYAIAGGNAVALWVARVEEAAVRNTQDVDILIRRADLVAARAALEAAGFVYRHAGGMEIFLDGAGANARDSVRLIFAGEKVLPHEPVANPDVDESEATEHFRVLSLEALVRIKLTAFRDKDRTHLRDLIEVGLIDAGWTARLPNPLSSRLQQLLDHPNG